MHRVRMLARLAGSVHSAVTQQAASQAVHACPSSSSSVLPPALQQLLSGSGARHFANGGRGSEPTGMPAPGPAESAASGKEANDHPWPPSDEPFNRVSMVNRPVGSKPEINSPELSFKGFVSDGIPRPGDYVVTELDENMQPVGDSGPDPNVHGGKQFVFHEQTIEDNMRTGNLPPQTDAEIAAMDASSPAGGPHPESLRPERSNTSGSPVSVGKHVSKRVKEVAGGVWDTLKHGVNNMGQPQIQEELKKGEP